MHPTSVKTSVITLSIIILLRLLTLGTSSLIDTTEGRYASISQEMALSNDWVTPKIHMESGLEPYKGKPPFHFWITAFSLNIFGMNEVAARLPTFIGGLVTLLLTFYFAYSFFSTELAIISSLILISSGQFFLLWGTVHLDFTLTASVTGIVVSWAFFVHRDGINQGKVKTSIFGYLIFVFAAIGMLTKGPVSLILAGLPIISWSLLRGELKRAFSIPWVTGICIFLVCVAPWFYFAEIASRGFIKYFFINENFLRYVSKDYGDKYGVGHTAFHGASVWMLIQGMLPWSLALLLLFQPITTSRRALFDWLRSFYGLAFLWGTFPALFFTLSKQILPAYMLPGFGGFSIFLSVLIINAWSGAKKIHLQKFFFWFSRISPFIALLLSPIGAIFFHASALQTTACFIISLLIIFYINTQNHKQEVYLGKSVALSALSLSLIFSSLLTSGGTFIGMRRSTGEIIQIIREKKSRRPFELGLIIGRNFSAQFYDNSSTTQPITLVRIAPENIVQSNISDFIIETSQLTTLPTDTFKTYTEQGRYVKWVWFTRNSTPN